MTASTLAGKRVLVTRAEDQAEGLAERLRAAGAEPVLVPSIEIAPPVDLAALDRAVAELASYAWVIFTSANGVRAFFDRLKVNRPHPDPLPGGEGKRPRVAAIGPATQAALAARGVPVDFVPPRFVAGAIAEWLGDIGPGTRVLLPRADIARKDLAPSLRARGALVDEVIAYRTRPAEAAADPAALGREIERGLDVLTFTSASTVRGFARLVEKAGLDLAAVAARASVVACIGPVTADAAAALGLRVDVVAGEHTVDGLTAALAAALDRGGA